MNPILVEGCVTSLEEAEQAFRAGAHRLELCRELATGGLTPETEVVEAVLARVGIPAFTMVRPDAGPFRAAPRIIGRMLREIEKLTDLGTAGVVLGVLDRSGNIDTPALKELVDAARVPVTFHRAFDEVQDPLHALDQLRETGVSRVLTSGGADSAWEGRAVLRELVAASGNDLVILGGGRVRGDHLLRLVQETGLREVHARATAIPGIVRALGLPPATEAERTR